MVQKLKPYLGDTWVEKNISLPVWRKAFKKLGIFNEDYHEKYRKYIHNKRYEKYIDTVIEDIKEQFESNIGFDQLIL